MKKKLNQYLIAVSVLAIVLTVLFTSLVFWKQIEHEAMSQVKSTVSLLANYVDLESGDEAAMEAIDESITTWNQGENPVRITHIASDGTVLFDNEADAGEMENHLSRPEVQEALADGTGESTRSSVTMGGQMTCYYAQLLSDGTILRGAYTTSGARTVFLQALPYICLIGAAIVGLAILVSWYLTHHFVQPIREMAEHPLDMNVPDSYEELKPLLTTIKNQQKDVILAAQQRQEFTANVSHELKTPLSAISGYAELIETGIASPEDTVRFGTEIHQNADRLLKLINDIIRLSELDMSAGSDTANEKLDLYTVADKCMETLRVEAKKYKVSIELEGHNSTIRADRQEMQELINNLCDNAIRYNKPGGTVKVTVDHDDEKVWLRVADTGIGIPKEHQKRIFERFYRVDKSRSRATGGTGLGLAIVKHIVQGMNGEIQLESELDVGTTITVLLPKQKEQEK